jgi:uncharacterized cupredoxin-like copper-binding protein
MQRPFTVLPLLAVALAATASAQNFSRAQVVQVTLSDYKFTPSTITLKAGQPTILRLKNEADQPHEFGAPEFFAKAVVRAADAKSVNKEGEAELMGHTQKDIGLVPKAGVYHLQCNKPGHAKLGMQGSINVK